MPISLGGKMNSASFVRAMTSISLPSVFNPYADSCEFADAEDGGAKRRCMTLRSYLSAVQSAGCNTMWMGRDLGYRGGRRTGLALTDEASLHQVSLRYPGAKAVKATKGVVVAERTAAEIWSVLMRVKEAPILWNVFPFHPYENGNHFSNRKFTARELSVAESINFELIKWLGVKRIVAIGQDAAGYSRRLGVEVVSIRHPSYGGVKDFREGMANVYGLNDLRISPQRELYV